MAYNNLSSDALSNMMDASQKQIENLANSLRSQKDDPGAYGITERNLIAEQAKLTELSASYQGAVLRESIKNFEQTFVNNFGKHTVLVGKYPDYKIKKHYSKADNVLFFIGILSALFGGMALPIVLSIIF